MTDQEIAEQFLNSIRNEIIDRHINLGQQASGETISRLKVTATAVGGVLTGPLHIGALDRGRGPTRGGGGGGGQTLQQRIFDWLQFAKFGISFSDNKERTSISFAIATKIHKEGNEIFKQGGSGLLTNLVTAQRLDALTGAFARNKAILFRSEILKGFKDAKIQNI